MFRRDHDLKQFTVHVQRGSRVQRRRLQEQQGLHLRRRTTGSYNQNCTRPIGNFTGGLTTNNGTTPFPLTWDTSLSGSICSQSTHPIDLNPAHITTIPSGTAAQRHLVRGWRDRRNQQQWPAAGDDYRRHSEADRRANQSVRTPRICSPQQQAPPFPRSTSQPTITTRRRHLRAELDGSGSAGTSSKSALSRRSTSSSQRTSSRFKGDGPLIGTTTTYTTTTVPTNTILGTTQPNITNSNTVTTGTNIGLNG